jgi:hypothetical protein
MTAIWYPLDHPISQEARKGFDSARAKLARSGIECLVTRYVFEHWHAVFEGKESYGEIARKHGVLKGSVHQLYRQYFEPYYESYTLYRNPVLEKEKTEASDLKRQQTEAKLLQHPSILLIKQHAALAGHTPQISLPPANVFTGCGGSFAFQMDHLTCRVFHRHTAFKPDPKHPTVTYASYEISSVGLARTDLHIFLALFDEPRAFVVPTLRLLELFKNGQHRRSIYIPIHQLKLHRGTSGVDYRKYLEAWWLLLGDKFTRAGSG